MFSQYVPTIVGETSAILFRSILIAAVSAVFESWRITDREEVNRDDYFLSSSLAFAGAILSFPPIFLAGGFSSAAYYLGPAVLLGLMAMWCVCFERWSGKWKRIKTRVGFFFLVLLCCGFLFGVPLTPAGATLLYSSQNLEPLALAIALFGLHWNQVIGSFNEAKHEKSSSLREAAKLFFRDRVNYFRFIGCVSSMLFGMMYVMRNLLDLGFIGTLDVFDLMELYMFIALLCIGSDFVLVIFFSEDTLKGVKKDSLNV